MMHPIELTTPPGLPTTMPPRARRWLDRCLIAAMLTGFARGGWFWSQQPTTDAAIQPRVAKPAITKSAAQGKTEPVALPPSRTLVMVTAGVASAVGRALVPKFCWVSWTAAACCRFASHSLLWDDPLGEDHQRGWLFRCSGEVEDRRIF